MKRVVLLAVVACAAIALSLAVMSDVTASPPSQPFVGAWESFDILPGGGGDGSYQIMVINGSPGTAKYKAVYHDFGCSACDPDAEPLYACKVIFSGTADGNVLSMEGQLWCLDHQKKDPMDTGTIVFVYNATDDTLESWTVWNRMGAR